MKNNGQPGDKTPGYLYEREDQILPGSTVVCTTAPIRTT